MALPRGLLWGREGREEATWREVYGVARGVEERCVVRGGRKGMVGWGVVGEFYCSGFLDGRGGFWEGGLMIW